MTMQSGVTKLLRVIMDPSEDYRETAVLEYVVISTDEWEQML